MVEKTTTEQLNDGFSYFHEEIGDFKGENEATNSFGQCKTFIGETGYT